VLAYGTPPDRRGRLSLGPGGERGRIDPNLGPRALRAPGAIRSRSVRGCRWTGAAPSTMR